MFFKIQHIKTILLTLIIILLYGCQLNDAKNKHGIVFLENRAKKLLINKTNKNDTIKILGTPHSISLDDDSIWIYIERTFTKGSYLKLGQNILKTNNVLILNYDKYGVLKEKKLLNKGNKEEIVFSEDITENKMSQRSFVSKFLNSIKTKMYGNK